MECIREDNSKDCNCTYPCRRKGKCCECLEHHRANNEFPACFFSKEAESTYDRSFEMLCKDRGKA